MSEHDHDILTVLRSIDASLKTLVQRAQARAPKEVATDRDLDGPYGDPIVKFLPRDWTGDPGWKGAHMSACPAELLDMLAETFDYFAQQAEAKNEQTTSGKAVAPYKRADAARARGWAKRVRAGHQAPAETAAGPAGSESDGWGSPEKW